MHPTVETMAPVEVTENGAVLEGELVFTGKESILDHGFVYGAFGRLTTDNAEQISLGPTNKPLRFQGLANRNLLKDKTYKARAYARTRNFIVYGDEISFVSKGSQAPEISDFYPADGVAGDTIVLKGGGFSQLLAHNFVGFNNVKAPVIKATTNTLQIIVPQRAGFGENEIKLTIGDYTAVAEEKFTVNEFFLESYSPAMLTFGDTLLLKGKNFSRRKDFIKVSAFGVAAEVLSSSYELIRFMVPNELKTYKSNISLTIAERTKTIQDTISLHPPRILEVSPSAVTKGTQIIVEGQYFSPLKEHHKAFLNDVPLDIISNSPTTLTLRVPSGIPSGKYPLVTEVLGQRVQSTELIEVIKPEITAITPHVGTWDEEVTIAGRNFGAIAENTVRFNDVEAKVIKASSQSIVVKVPRGLKAKESVINVRVHTVDNLEATAEKPFMLHDPVVHDFYPKEGKSGATITIKGQGFHPEHNVVNFGEFTAGILFNSTEEIQVQLPDVLVDSEVGIQISAGEVSGSSSASFKLIAPWRQVAEFPIPYKTEAVGFSIDQYGYAGLGSNDPIDFPKPFWKYDPATDQWIEISSYKFDGRGVASNFQNMTAFVIEENGYAGIGRSRGSYLNYLSSYDPLADTWSSSHIDIFPGEILEGAVSFSLAGKGYIATGRSSSGESRQLWLYDPATGRWHQKKDLPGQARTESSGFTLSGKGYILGGVGGGTYLSDVWEYDPAQDTWQAKRNFPAEARASAIAFHIQDKAYIMGGVGMGGKYLKDLWEYDKTSDSWSELGSFPGRARANAVVFVVNGKAYVGTGQTKIPSGTEYLNDFWEFDPSKL